MRIVAALLRNTKQCECLPPRFVNKVTDQPRYALALRLVREDVTIFALANILRSARIWCRRWPEHRESPLDVDLSE